MRRYLLLSLVLLACVGGNSFVSRPGGWDQWQYAENERVAVSLARGNGWSDSFGSGTGATAHVAPGYPLLLAGIYSACGGYESETARIVQRSFALAVAIVLLLLIPATARKLGFPAATGWFAAFVSIRLFSWQWANDAVHHEQGICALALVAALWVVAALHESGWRSPGLNVRAGLFFGFIALFCPNLLLVPILYFVVELAKRTGERTQIIRGGLLAAAVCFACLLPWAVRNYMVLGGFVPLRSNLGLELAVGNRPGATGHTYACGFKEVHPFACAAEVDRLKQMGELAYMKDKQQQALAWIAANPSEFGQLAVKRARLFWLGTDETWLDAKIHLRPTVHIPWLMGVAALIELVRLLRRKHPGSWLLVCTCVGVAFPYVFTHVEPRYRLPILSIFALLNCNLALAVRQWVVGKLRRPSPQTDADIEPILLQLRTESNRRDNEPLRRAG